MTNQHRQRAALPRWRSVGRLRRAPRPAAVDGTSRAGDAPRVPRFRQFFARHRRLLRRTAIGIGVLCGLVTAGCLALWWRLGAGPIQIDVATPWLVSAIEENFGSSRHVEIGGTQIERTENGATAVRIRDIVVRDADGTVVASAPKAEVRVSGMSLFSGHMRAESLNLVGAEMAVRIEQDGRITIFAGADKRPIATASVPVSAAAALLRSAQEKREATGQTPSAAATRSNSGPITVSSPDVQAGASRRARDVFAALLSWIDGIGETGLDGHDLSELGLKNGNLTVDDERTGKHWTFQDISLSVERAHGGVEVSVGSDNPARSWALKAAVTPTRQGYRKIQLEARRVLVSDLLLASRLGDGNLGIDTPLSASITGEIGPDGLPQIFSARIVADAGSIGDANDDGRIAIDHAEVKMNWDAANRVLSVPFQILSGANRITLLGQVEAPEQADGVWSFKIGGGTVVLGSSEATSKPLVLNRIAVSGRYDTAKQRFVVDEGDVGNTGVGVAMSGNVDFSSGAARLTAGFAGTRMSVDAVKRLWPVFVVPKVRDWFNEHLVSGTVERIVIAVNSPFENLKADGPPVADDGLSIDALVTGSVIRPVDGLPALHDADLNVHIVGRDAIVAVGKATADLASGRKLVMSSGMFEVPDTAPHAPLARVRFRLDGPVPAAGELLHMDRLREFADAPFDISTIRGTMSGQVSLGMPLKSDLPPGSTNYAITLDATNFSADHMIMGQKVEAALLRASATPQGFQLKGDVKIGGAPASLEYRKARGDNEADIRIAGMLDETARSNLGFDSGDAISGAIPIRLNGRLATTSDREGRFAVEADLTPAQIDGLLPGWAKPSGKPARATFVLITKPQSIRVEDLLIEGAGGGVKGTIDFDGSGEVQSANFPAFGFSDGDRASLKIERAADGALRVIMRGEVYDGRGFVKTAAGAASASSNPNAKRHNVDVDFDMRLGAVVGFNGEAMRGVDLKMSRRAGEVRSFGITAKIGRDATLTGDLRGRSNGHQVIYLESNDAGAFFRFTDVYSRMTGGQMSIAMDPPAAENSAQQGTLNVRNFAVHDETQLERAVANGSQPHRNAIDFSGMRVEFTRMPGRVGLREGVVRGPLLGGTIDGLVDYAHDEVHLRGTLVPLYGPNNLLGQIPVVGLFMGGDKEGLFGVTYEVVGRPSNPVMRINPISALAPGLLRKVFEFPANGDSGAEQFPNFR